LPGKASVSNVTIVTAPAPDAPTPDALERRLPLVPLVALASVALLDSLVSVVYLPALPAIARSYHASAALLGWSLSIPALVGGAAYPLGGRLGDLYGRRPVVLALLGLFVAGSACLAVFHSDASLLIGRSAQGGLAAATPLSVALATELVGPERRAHVLPPIVAVVGAGFGVGFLGGAVAVDKLGLEGMSAALAGLGAAGIAVIWLLVRPPRREAEAGGVDWTGALLLCTSVGMLLLALGQASSWGWSSPQILGLLIGAAVLLLAFAVRQATATDALIPRDLLARRPVPVIWVVTLCVALALVGVYVLVPELLESPASLGGLGLSPTQAGIVLLAPSAAYLLGGVITAATIARTGVALATAAGMVLSLCGYAGLAATRGTVAATAAFASVTFLGTSVAIAAVSYGTAQAAPPRTVATALALNTMVIAIGNAIAVQLLAAVVTHVGTVGGLPTHDAYTAGFLLGAGLSLVAIVAAVAALGVLLRLPRDQPYS
jgi:MFS family permease